MGRTMTNSPALWPELLATSEAIAAHVGELSPYEICEEQIEEMYLGCQAKLEWTHISRLRLGPDNNNVASEERQEACDSRPTETMPPLLAEDGMIMDGAHRYRTLLSKGCAHCWVYHIEPIPEPEPKPARRSEPDDLSP